MPRDKTLTPPTPERPRNLLALDRDGLQDFMQSLGEKPFRARQVFARLHRHINATKPDDFLRDLPKASRERLAPLVTIAEPPLTTESTAADGVRKLLFATRSDQLIEAVIIPEERRATLCVSSQAGCALACKFCLTGKQGFSHNLSADQILSQLRAANRLIAPAAITNVVMMGMGEPLLNPNAVFPALRAMTDKLAYALPPRRVTLSTAGVVPMMRRLRDECNVSLAVSLHAPTDSLRDELVPINQKYNLSELMSACAYHLRGRARASVTFEYVMLAGVNDSAACARDLIRLVHGLRCKVNLIPFNSFAGAPYKCSPWRQMADFRHRLIRSGIMTTIRKTRGDDILAACGQLAGDIRARTYGLGKVGKVGKVGKGGGRAAAGSATAMKSMKSIKTVAPIVPAS